MSTSIPVAVVRVFTTAGGSLGNELGLVESSAATAGREQEIARALNFSETVFVDRIEVATSEVATSDAATSDAATSGTATSGTATSGTATTDGSTATIRIFTPASELPFAGHPSVGAAWWLRERGTPAAVLAEPAGDVAVRFEGHVTWITGRASWAPDFTWHELATPADVESLDPTVFDEGHHYLYAWVDENAGRIRSRMFAPVMGITEDQATGSAAVALTGRLGRDLDITQGRGSHLVTRHLGEGFIEVGGSVVADRDRAIELA